MQLRPGTTGRIQFKVVVILVILITMIYDPHRGVILLSPHDHLYHRDSWSFSSSSSSRSWWLMIILISSQSKMTKAGSKGQGLPSGPLLPHGLVLVKNLSTFNLVQQHMDIAPKTWSWSNLSLSTGRWGVQGITWHSWARRSWKASSQWHSLSADGSHQCWSISNSIPTIFYFQQVALRQKTKALATGFGSFVEKNLPPFSRWSEGDKKFSLLQ